MATLGCDLKFGFRLLFRNPGFTSVAALALALGIGANTAMFSVVYATLLAPLPYPHPEQLVEVWSKYQGLRSVTAAGNFLEWQRASNSFQFLAAWSGADINLATSNRPERLEALAASPGFLTMMGYGFLSGRDFLPDEGQVGRNHEAILTNRLWKSRFGGDRGIVGRDVQMNGQPYSIVGVLAPGPADRLGNGLHIPLAFNPDQINDDYQWLGVTGRLKPSVTLAQANADMDAITRHLADVNPKADKGWSATVEPFKNDFLNRDMIRGLWLLMGAVGFVLLIACANVANLLLARATTRQKEVAVRASLGASRQRLFAQFLAESLALAAVGCLTGIGLSWLLLKLIVAMVPPFRLPSDVDIRMNLPVLLFTVGVSLLTGVLFGCAPAWRAARMNLNEVLKEGGRGLSIGRHSLRRSLVVVEFALALSLLAGAGLAIRSLWNVAHVDLGFRSDHLFTFYLPVPDGRLTEPQKITAFYRQLIERIQLLPGVSSASVSEGLPLEGDYLGMPFQISGKVVDRSQRPNADFNMVSPGYFRTFGIRIDRGRAITEQDIAGGVPVAVVNEALAKKCFPNVDPLTQRILVEELIPGVTKLGPEIEWQIVGVYHNVRYGRRRDQGFPEIDVPFWQSPWPQATMAVRAAGDPAALNKSIADIVQSLDPNLPIADPKTMDQIMNESMAGDRFTAFLFGGFAGIALLLAALGIYSVMSFAVAQRTHEIGLRMALGAGSGRVFALILREGMILAAVGLALGLGGACVVGRGMHSLFYNVGTIDVTAFSAVAILLLFSALLACYVPARRATRIDPMLALRRE